MKYKCLSIVKPNGTRIAKGDKTIEVRSWLPEIAPGEDILIIENEKFLMKDGDNDVGVPVALVKIKTTRPYIKEDIPSACATRWEPGYFSWELENVRPVNSTQLTIATRGIYEIELDL